MYGLWAGGGFFQNGHDRQRAVWRTGDLEPPTAARAPADLADLTLGYPQPLRAVGADDGDRQVATPAGVKRRHQLARRPVRLTARRPLVKHGDGLLHS